ncbi:hypothetical protein MDAP_002168 [Mitosporidium daphniae]
MAMKTTGHVANWNGSATILASDAGLPRALARLPGTPPRHAGSGSCGMRFMIQRSAAGFVKRGRLIVGVRSSPTSSGNKPIIDDPAGIIMDLEDWIPMIVRITLTLASRRASAIKAIQGFLSQRMGPGEPEERQSWIHDALGSFSATKRPLKAFQHIFAAKSSLGKYELLALNAEPVQNEDIYLRADVFRGRSKEAWHQQGMEIIGEGSGKNGIYGPWDVTRISAPSITEEGKIPRNAHGNIYLFTPWMIPHGCVHLKALPIAAGTAIRRAGIEVADAVVWKESFS